MWRFVAFLSAGILLAVNGASVIDRGDAPKLESKPATKGPILTTTSFVFKCEFEITETYEDQIFEVSWSFNNQTDPSVAKQVLRAAQRVATLDGDKLRAHVDKKIQCTVRTYYEQTPRIKYVYYGTIITFGVEAVSLPEPVLKGTKSFDFQNEITAGSEDSDVNVEYIWTFNGQQDPKVKPRIVSAKQKNVTLPGQNFKGHFNTEIAAQARLVIPTMNLTTAFVKSRSYFAGIKMNPKKLQIKGSDKEKIITVTSTVPVVCNTRNCCMKFKANIDKSSVVSLKDSCTAEICSEDWNPDTKEATTQITAVPNKNTVFFTPRKAKLSFDAIEVTGDGLTKDVAAGIPPDDIEIEEDPEECQTCPITGDPHFALPSNTAFIYDLYQTGDYIAYEVKERDFVIQIRTWPCWLVTCTCGLVVKEKNDIIRLNGCNHPGNAAAATLDIPYPLSAGTVVQRSANGANVAIKLSSGTEIKVYMSYIHFDTYITGPPSDKYLRRGICGKNDGVPGNTFTHPDGTVTPLCTGPGRCIPVAFTESWRVDGNASMFVVAPSQVKDEPAQQFCSCFTNAQGKSVNVCSPREHIQDTNIGCTNCKTVNTDLKPKPWGTPGFEEKPYEHKPVPAVDPNQKWPNAKGTTEAQAKDLCLKAIQKSQLYTKCKTLTNVVDFTVNQCLGDVLNGGTTDFVGESTSIFTSRCQIELAKDENNYTPGPDGKLSLLPDIVEVCSPDCEDHGQCDNDGTCKCQRGWEGESCTINTEKGPQISWPDGPSGKTEFVCHDAKKPCESVQFETSNVEIFEKLTCRVQAVDDKGNKIGIPLINQAPADPSPKVTCPVPKTDAASQKFTFSVSNEKGKTGNELTVLVYDPTCLQCDTSACTVKSNFCNINNKCYKDGEKNPKNAIQSCQAKKSQTSWTGGSVEFPLLEKLKDLVKQICDLLSLDKKA